MTVKHVVERTIYVSTCPKCGDRQERDTDPPRERWCGPCSIWVPFEAVAWTGPDRFDRQSDR